MIHRRQTLKRALLETLEIVVSGRAEPAYASLHLLTSLGFFSQYLQLSTACSIVALGRVEPWYRIELLEERALRAPVLAHLLQFLAADPDLVFQVAAGKDPVQRERDAVAAREHVGGALLGQVLVAAGGTVVVVVVCSGGCGGLRRDDEHHCQDDEQG